MFLSDHEKHKYLQRKLSESHVIYILCNTTKVHYTYLKIKVVFKMNQKQVSKTEKVLK